MNLDPAVYDIVARSNRWSAVFGKKNNIAAFILISPSNSARSYDPCLAAVHVIRSREVTDMTYLGLVDEAVKMTSQLDIGYTDCVMSVATSCVVLIETLRLLGFTVIARLPHSISMTGVGLTDTVLMIRNLGVRDRPVSMLIQLHWLMLLIAYLSEICGCSCSPSTRSPMFGAAKSKTLG